MVERFFRTVAADSWLDYGYNPDEAARMLYDREFVRISSVEQIRSMLTFCVRGERFSDGHWGEMIEKGHIRALLERLAVLRAQATGSDPE